MPDADEMEEDEHDGEENPPLHAEDKFQGSGLRPKPESEDDAREKDAS